MAELNQQQVVDYIKGITVLELSQLVKALETELGVSAAAAMPMAMPGRRRRGGRRGPGRREDRVHRDADRSGRQQDQRDQGRPRSHQPRPEGSQGPRRGGAQAGQGRRPQGRGAAIKKKFEDVGAKVEIEYRARRAGWAVRGASTFEARPGPVSFFELRPTCPVVRPVPRLHQNVQPSQERLPRAHRLSRRSRRRFRSRT